MDPSTRRTDPPCLLPARAYDWTTLAEKGQKDGISAVGVDARSVSSTWTWAESAEKQTMKTRGDRARAKLGRNYRGWQSADRPRSEPSSSRSPYLHRSGGVLSFSFSVRTEATSGRVATDLETRYDLRRAKGKVGWTANEGRDGSPDGVRNQGTSQESFSLMIGHEMMRA